MNDYQPTPLSDLGEAKRIKAVLKNSPNPRAVFMPHTKCMTVDLYGARFDRMMMDFPASFMGVYTNAAPVEWIEEDISYMRRRYANFQQVS